MESEKRLHHAWPLLATYGVWFAIFSGLEEAASGKVWKLGLSLLLGVIIIIEARLKR